MEEGGRPSEDVQMLLDGLEVGTVSGLKRLVDEARELRVGGDRLFVNESRTVLVRFWASGVVEVATRDEPGFTWRPPVYLTEER